MKKPQLMLQLFLLVIFVCVQSSHARKYYRFELQETTFTKLCSTKKILAVNGQFPGPTIYAHKGDTIIVDVHNKGTYNVTVHWHGVKQPRNPWTDGPEYITQCPIPPGGKFRQRVILSTEEGTLWWHAHSNWTRATVHGAILIYPKKGTSYPYPKPHAEIPIILSEWWKIDIEQLYYNFINSGGDPITSDAYTINGQPGDLYPCPNPFKLNVDYGKTYLLRLINAALQNILFFAVANHNLTVVGTDAAYTKPITSTYITISPGQTIDVLLTANQSPSQSYYMAASALESTPSVTYDNTTTTAIISYNNQNYTTTTPPLLPSLPAHNDTQSSANFTGRLRSLTNQTSSSLPTKVNTKLLFTLSVNAYPCTSNDTSTCQGPNTTRLASSINNVSFIDPTIDILQAYYYRHIIKNNSYYTTDFPDFPPVMFNYTAENLPLEYEIPTPGTKVRVLEYNDTVELVFQGTNVVAGANHPMHLHGYSFYVVGWGFGNFDKDNDPVKYNLVDPPLQNTIAVPYNGWAAIRFRADNPGVWFLHCHLDRHLSWGMDMAFIVKNGKEQNQKLLPPPPDMPPC